MCVSQLIPRRYRTYTHPSLPGVAYIEWRGRRYRERPCPPLTEQ